MWKQLANSRIVRPIIIGFFFSAGFFFVVGSGMTLFTPWVSGLLGVACLFLGLFLLVLWYGKGENVKNVNQKNQGKPHIGVNLTIDSKDFISMDAECMKAFFDGVERIVKATKEGATKEGGRAKEFNRK